MPRNADSLLLPPSPSRTSASGGVWHSPRENKTIIFDNLHQYHLRCSLAPAPLPRTTAIPLHAPVSSGNSRKLNKPIVSSIDLIWGPENSADSTVLNY